LFKNEVSFMERAAHARKAEESQSDSPRAYFPDLADVAMRQWKDWGEAQFRFFETVHDAQSSWLERLHDGAMFTSSIAALAESQLRFARTLQEANIECMRRLQREMAIAADLGTNLTNARSPADVVAAWQDCISQRIELMGADASYFTRAMQGFFSDGVRAFTRGSGRRLH
jgi:hypothetical protein